MQLCHCLGARWSPITAVTDRLLFASDAFSELDVHLAEKYTGIQLRAKANFPNYLYGPFSILAKLVIS